MGAADLSPTSHASAGALPGKAFSVRHTLHAKKSLRPGRPLSLSALVRNDPISTGKDADDVGRGAP